MLTPEKINEKSFQTTGRGSYRADDVDAFMREVSSSYEQVFKENTDLIKKITILAKKVEEYRADEESLKLALLNAQKLADKIVAEAKEKTEAELKDAGEKKQKLIADAKEQADLLTSNAKKDADELIAKATAKADSIVKEANAQSEEILGAVNRNVTHESLVYEMIQKEASDFKSRLVAMYKEHINLINKLPEIAEEQIAEQEKIEETVKEEEPEQVVVAKEQEPQVIVEEEADEPIEEPVIDNTAVEDEAQAEAEEPLQAEEIKAEENVPAKKPFKLNLENIDFADEEPVYDSSVEAEPTGMNFSTVEAEEDEQVEVKANSFKSFFKKK